MMNKKAQGFSIEIVVVAIIAIVVLVVLLYIFSSQASIFTRTLEDCKAREGVGVDTRADCANGNGIAAFEYQEGKSKKVCCIYGG